MDFSVSDDHEALRDGIRRICADFPDEYWAAKDEAHEFPWDFYQAMAEETRKGRLSISLDRDSPARKPMFNNFTLSSRFNVKYN